MEFFLPTIYTSASPSITDDEFNLFHSIDRKLYTRLAINLRRDPKESMQVMAFWLWLEQDVLDNLKLVKQMLSLPSTLVNELADESVMCLKCVENDTFPFEKDTYKLVLLPNFVQRDINLQYFYQNRIGVVRGMSRMIGEVCSRAFRDLLEKNTHGTGFFSIVPQVSRNSASEKECHGGVTNPTWEEKGGETSSFGEILGESSNIGVTNTVVQSPINAYSYWSLYHPMSPFGEVFQMGGENNAMENKIMENGLCDIFRSTLKIMEEEKDEDISPDERTIFLTFSKGYPISEIEVRDFFTRKFGDFIEAIHMQEVPPNEQVLFARVVSRSASVVDTIVEPGRAKYNINGKHVWARKYVKKHRSPPLRIALASNT
ncbi:hypothetical protein ACH5RR_016181 [Cinchona calisaya]|uniref:Uncharacterized protein n=1 Tax=Cinchona calisaya TaxID=153742 RepID=A0ABD2ZV89_9GENT